jgi:hypothetical protein
MQASDRERQLVKNVWQENHVFLRNILFYSSDYLCFVKDFICQFKFPEQLEVKREVISQSHLMLQEAPEDPDCLSSLEKTPALKVIKLMMLSSYQTLMKNNDSMGFVNSMQTVLTLYQKFLPASFWLLNYLTENKQFLFDVLFESSLQDVKHSFTKVLTHCIQQCARVEEGYILETVVLDDKTYSKSALIRFIQEMPIPNKNNLKRTTEWIQVLHSTVA